MAYYTALIAAWNSGTQPPAGVTGTALTALTTAQKVAAVNGWKITVPLPCIIPSYSIYNVIVPAEFTAAAENVGAVVSAPKLNPDTDTSAGVVS